MSWEFLFKISCLFFLCPNFLFERLMFSFFFVVWDFWGLMFVYDCLLKHSQSHHKTKNSKKLP